MTTPKVDTLLEQASQALERGDWQNAKTVLIQAQAIAPLHPEVLQLLGMAAVQAKDFIAAEQWLQQAIAQDPNEATHYTILGNILQTQKRYAAAIEALQKAIALNPDYPEAYNNLANVYFHKKQYAEAKACYEKAIHLRPDYLAALYNLGLIQQKQGEIDQAIISYQQILKQQPTLPEVHYQLAKLYQQQADYPRALDHYQRVLDKRPQFIEAMHNIGVIYLELKQYNLAQAYLEKAAQLEANSADLQYNLGVIAMRQGENDKAIIHFSRTIELNPDYVEAHQNLGNILSELQQIEQAILHYQTVLRLQPENESVKYMLAAISQQPTASTAPAHYVETLFDNYAEQYEKHLLDKLQYHAHDLLVTALKAQQVLTADKLSIIDLGCGTGLCGELLKPYASYLIGIDLSKKMLAVAEKRHIYDELIAGDISTKLNALSTNANLIIAADVFTYIGDLSPIFQQAASHLTPNGHFAFTIEKTTQPNYQLLTTARFAHNNDYITSLAKQCNFIIQHSESINLRKHEDEFIQGQLYLLQR